MKRNATVLLCALGGSLFMAGGARGWELNLGTNLPPVDFHGFVSQGFLYSTDYDYLGDTEDGSFEFSEVGLNATWSPFNRTRIAVQGFAFDVGDVGNWEPVLDYASLEYTFNNYIGIRGGRVRRPGGIYNHIQDVDLARTSVLLPQGMYDARWRDFSMSVDGGEVFGNIPLGKAGSLSYELYSGIARLGEDGGLSHLLQKSFEAQGGTASVEPTFLTAGGQFWWHTPLSGLRLGAALSESLGFNYDGALTGAAELPPGSGNIVSFPIDVHAENDAFVQQYSIEYLWKSFTFQGEYQRISLDTTTTTTMQIPGMPMVMKDDSDTARDSWYIGAAYRVNNWLEVGTYYSEFYPDADNRGDASQRDTALSFRFDPTDWWILKVEGHYIRGTALLDPGAGGNNDDCWWMFGVKTTFYF